MTENEIIEGNKLIAEFWGSKPLVDEDGIDYWEFKDVWYDNFNDIMLGGNWLCGNFQFHKSWDWLMPIIDKIENIGEDVQSLDDNYHFFIGKRLVRVVYDWNTYSTFDENNSFADLERYNKSQREYRYSLYGSKLETTWQAVVDFIRWYNIKIMDIEDKGHEYTAQLFGSLEDCKYQYDKKIGSYWCTAECPYCTNLVQECDQHGRLDLIRFNCIAK